MSHTRLAALFCAALLVSACTAPATRTAVAPETGSDAAAPVGDVASATTVAATAEEDDPIVCESVARTGTRVAKRLCMRRSEMEKRERDAQEMLGEVQRRAGLGNSTRE